MQSKKAVPVIVAMVIACGALLACSGVSSGPGASLLEADVYLQSNVHYQDRVDRGGDTVSRASYANYTDPGAGHNFLPVNTRVSVGKWRGGFTLTRVEDGKVIFFEYKKGNMGGMTVSEYLDLITSPAEFSLKGLSALDRKGIEQGRVFVGMTKEGVRMAYGYPAVHRTPSLAENVWTYWRNRWATTVVEFGPDDRVRQIR